jgi:single-strand DNA-binding protein
LVFVEGQPEARSFQRNDGTPGSSLSVRVRDIQLLGGRKDSAGGGSYQSNTAAAASSSNSNVPSPSDITEPVDDLPF